MKTEDHLRNINESLEVITESIQKGLQERQRNLSFNISAASVEMLEVFLHNLSIINPGSNIKHDWFSSQRKAREKIKFDFPHKDEIIDLLANIESKRNIFCYGKPQPIENIKSLLEYFNKLKTLFENEGLKWN